MLDKYKDNPYIGQLLCPQDGNLIRPHLPVAVDNSAFSDWDESKYIALLDKLQGYKVLWVSAPDVVGDAQATSRLYDKWMPEIRKRGFPVALVLQDGQEWIGLPHPDDYDAIFIGGTTEFKLGAYARYCVQRVHEDGKLAHMGRVNSIRRAVYAYDIGCDSIDGSGYSRFPQKVKPLLSALSNYKKHQLFPFITAQKEGVK